MLIVNNVSFDFEESQTLKTLVEGRVKKNKSFVPRSTILNYLIYDIAFISGFATLKISLRNIVKDTLRLFWQRRLGNASPTTQPSSLRICLRSSSSSRATFRRESYCKQMRCLKDLLSIKRETKIFIISLSAILPCERSKRSFARSLTQLWSQIT